MIISDVNEILMSVNHPESNIKFLTGGGEMGNLIRDKDWGNTSLGSLQFWPENLRTTLSVILHSRFPMFLWWGPELICFYNDAYRPSLGKDGKHPSILGMKAEEAWAEIWDIIKPLIDQVRAGAGATWSEDQLVPIYRNGKIEDVYWTYSYSPVIDDAGNSAGVLVTVVETTGTVNALKALKESNKRFLNDISQAPVAMCFLRGKEHIVEIANEQMLEIWGKTSEQVINKPVFEGLPEAKGQGLEILVAHVYNTGEKLIANERPVKLPRNGAVETAYINFACEALREPDGNISGIVAIASDVTIQVVARKRIEESEKQYRELALTLEQRVNERTIELNARNKELEKINKELQSFAYISSHDLQEPLRKIQTFSSRLAEKEYNNLTENGKAEFKRMQNAAVRMQNLIDDLLSYARTATAERKFEDFDLNILVEEVKADLGEDIQQKHAIIEITGMCNAHIIPFQFRQLFYNLISNSLKFSHTDYPPHIKITSKVSTENGSANNKLLNTIRYCHIAISDNGIGFEQQYSEKIFELFQRLHGKAEYTGTGIGLAIVKKIVENHNGVITATGEINKGAAFDIYIPSS